MIITEMCALPAGAAEAAVRGGGCHRHVRRRQDQCQPPPPLPQCKVLRKVI